MRAPIFWSLPFFLLTVFLVGCGGSSSSSGASTHIPLNNNAEINPPINNDTNTEKENAVVPKPINYKWTHYEREEEYPKTVKTPLWIEVNNGDGSGSVRLSATLMQPADDNGKAIEQPLPTIVTITGYSQALIGLVPEGIIDGLVGSNPYLVKRGYNYITIDERGTGSSEGSWQAFGPQSTQNDIAQILDFVGTQEWSNGKLAMNGPSLMGINGLFAGVAQSEYLKAIFATVPSADPYRDIVFQGGQINAGFIPLWLGLVEILGIVPTPAEITSDNPVQVINNLVSRLQTLVAEEFPIGFVAKALLNQGNAAYDSDFWKERAVINYADRIQVPTFVVGGLDDLFQRGEPLIYEALKGHNTTKLIMGPWQHLDGSAIAGLEDFGIPSANQIQLAWFDKYLKNIDSGADEFPPVTQFFKGENKYYTTEDWIHPETTVTTFFLQGKPALFEVAELPVKDLGEVLNILTHKTPLGTITNILFDLVTQISFGILNLGKIIDSAVGLINPEKLADTLVTLLDPAPGKLSTEPNEIAGVSSVLQHPIGGLCSRSTSQWTAGIAGVLLPFCSQINNFNEIAEIVFSTDPFEEDMIINGPIAAELWVSTTARNTGLSVTITDVDESGFFSRALTNGVLLASMRQLDEEKSRYVDGKLIQPWHPFTRESELPVEPNTPFLAQIEIFPTSAVIKKGHSLRVSIGSSDISHGLSTLPDLLDGAVGVLSIYSSEEYPSRVNIPVIPRSALHEPVNHGG